MVCTLYYPADSIGLLILALVNSFYDGFRAVLLSGWHGGSFICSLVNGSHNVLHAVLLGGWQRIAQNSTCERLSRRFACRISQRIVVDCSFILSPTAFMTVCVPYCSADGSALLILPLVHSFSDGSQAITYCRGYPATTH